MEGTNGMSAYEVAIENGFEGTEQEWLDTLHGLDSKNIEVRAAENYVQWRYTGEEWQNIIPIPDFNFVGTYSLTTLIDGVSSEFIVNPVAASKALVKYAVFADAENISGIIPVANGFTSLPVIFESDRITVNFYNNEDLLTFTTLLKELNNFGILKHGTLNIKEAGA